MATKTSGSGVVKFVDDKAVLGAFTIERGGEMLAYVSPSQTGDESYILASKSDLLMDGVFKSMEALEEYVYGELANAEPAPAPAKKTASKNGRKPASKTKKPAAKKEESEAQRLRREAREEKQREKDAAARERDDAKRRYEALEGLLPTKAAPRGRIVSVPLSDIDGIHGGDPPGPEFIASIAKHGIIQPPRVMSAENGRYFVVAGKRRLAAALELLASGDARFERVDVLVDTRTAAQVNENVTALIENLQRSENAIDQYRRVQALVNAGFDVKQIARATNIESRELRRILDMRRLHPDLMTAVEENRMPTTAARWAVRLQESEQDELVRQMNEREDRRVTVEMVESVKKAGQGSKVAEHADRLSEDPEGEEAPRAPKLRGRTQRRAYAVSALRGIESALADMSERDDDEDDLLTMAREFIARFTGVAAPAIGEEEVSETDES